MLAIGYDGQNAWGHCRMKLDLRALFLAHGPGLRHSLTRQFGDPALAADMVQDTFVRLAGMPADVQIMDARGFLGRIARNLALNHLRQVGQRRTATVAPDTLFDIPDQQPSAEDALDAQRRLGRLRDAVAALPLRTRQVFVLTRLSGLSYAAAAKELGISESSVQKHLARALLHVMERGVD